MSNQNRCNNCMYQGNELVCMICSDRYTSKFSPVSLKENECMCTHCKKIFTDQIFRRKDDKHKGLCFNCF